jgi:hypothetical protein
MSMDSSHDILNDIPILLPQGATMFRIISVKREPLSLWLTLWLPKPHFRNSLKPQPGPSGLYAGLKRKLNHPAPWLQNPGPGAPTTISGLALGRLI